MSTDSWPPCRKQTKHDHAREAHPLFKDHSAARMVENWGDDVPEGKVTDFHRSVRKKDDEAVLFSWIEWPSREARDAGMKALMQDQRMKTLKMPFDGQRLIFGGFSPIVETGSAKSAGYADGFVVPVPVNRDAYIRMSLNASSVFTDMARSASLKPGAMTYPTKVTDFRRAVEAKDGETIVFSWSNGRRNRRATTPGPS
jgi:uncharacterized protein YbaA (DUF1428 family)